LSRSGSRSTCARRIFWRAMCRVLFPRIISFWTIRCVPSPLQRRMLGSPAPNLHHLEGTDRAAEKQKRGSKGDGLHPEKAIVVERIVQDLLARLSVLLDLGLGYLTLERSTSTLSPGELQRLRLATQVRSNLFGVVYVLDAGAAPGGHGSAVAGVRSSQGGGQFSLCRRA
jgi:hypothetical protein